jgi:mannosylglucosylglycerate synthase
MNVALIHYSAPPVVGGVESVLAHHAHLLAEAGHAVRVIAARGEQWDERIPLVRVPLADSRHPDILAVKAELDAGRVPPAATNLRDQLAAAVTAALDGVEVLIAHNVCSLNKNLPLTMALHDLYRQPGFPRLVLWHHDLAWTTPRYRSELYAGYPWDLLRADWPGASQVVVSEARQHELAALLNLPPERIRVVPNGVDIAAFYQLEVQTAEYVQQLDLLSAAPLLLLPARLTPRKNIELALRVLARLRADFPRAALLVTGPIGAHNAANVTYFTLLRQLRTELRLEGAAYFLAELTNDYLPDAVIAGFFRLADALFLPSREEGFGIPILEAALSRLPIFCADIPPLRALGREDAAYFSPEADPARVATQIANHFSHDQVFHLASRIRQHFTWPQIYRQQIEPLLKESE